MSDSEIKNGKSCPLGAAVQPDGVNFSVYSKNATSMDLLLFDNAEDLKPAHVVSLDARQNRTYYYWHAFVPGVAPGQLYGFRASGPSEPSRGMRFSADRVLLDPYGRLVAMPSGYNRRNPKTAPMKSIVADLDSYDWEDDVPLHRSFVESVIYELHVRGFTRHPSSGVAPERAGTYAGLVEKIPYLLDLGITAVELMPVFQFDPTDAPEGRVNYWGYSPVSFFAPHRAYSSRQDALGPIDEFRDMVKAFHRAGIEVILDVVFNHTAEGREDGPTFCFRGLENGAYYILDRQDPSRYADYSGTGNTLNANQPIVRRLILDSLRYWVTSMHVDGFRFDLASVLTRDETGAPVANPPIIWDIESDPALAGTKIIAEAWDAAGLYQVGSFVGDNWHEWNGRFRDDLRRFLKSDNATVPSLASRLLGSPDIYARKEREAEQSVNFVTCHDGFTLNDLVSYDHKHNEANGEANHDGMNENLSWNCGTEGPVEDPAIEKLRSRQIKNFIVLNLLSLGTPMLLMGDEVRRTQRGNNNAYCQDNEVSWFDWSLLKTHSEIHRFTRMMLWFRRRREMVVEKIELSLNKLLAQARLGWHGVKLNQPDWSDGSHSLALTVSSIHGRFKIHAMMNAYWEPLEFELPESQGANGNGWRRWIDTALPSPEDIAAWEEAPLVSASRYTVAPRSTALLVEIQSE